VAKAPALGALNRNADEEMLHVRFPHQDKAAVGTGECWGKGLPRLSSEEIPIDWVDWWSQGCTSEAAADRAAFRLPDMMKP
jgi:hypothetical protein